MFLTSLETVAILLLMAVPGFIIGKLKMIDNEKSVKFISVLLLYVCQPFITFNSFLNTDYTDGILINALTVFLFTAVLMVGLALLGRLFVSFDKRIDGNARGLIAYAGSMGNIGYMCIPFLQILVPDSTEVILYASTAIVAFNLVAWTLGNYLITGDKKFISFKRAILNPPAISFILVIPLFVLNINFNRFTGLGSLQNMFRLFANLVGPLSMVMLGIKFTEINLKEIFLDYRVYIGVAIKLVLSPLIAVCLILLIGTFMDVSAIKLNLLALAAMPTANNIMMFSALYDKDVKLSAKFVMVSTILSIITIPLFLMLLPII